MTTTCAEIRATVRELSAKLQAAAEQAAAKANERAGDIKTVKEHTAALRAELDRRAASGVRVGPAGELGARHTRLLTLSAGVQAMQLQAQAELIGELSMTAARAVLALDQAAAALAAHEAR